MDIEYGWLQRAGLWLLWLAVKATSAIAPLQNPEYGWLQRAGLWLLWLAVKATSAIAA